MSVHDNTKRDIEEILTRAFSPVSLLVIDDSAAHRGHKEALLHASAGHFKVVMKSAQFNGQNAVKRHRMVYEKLATLMDEKIHALSLNLISCDE